MTSDLKSETEILEFLTWEIPRILNLMNLKSKTEIL